MVGSIFMLLFSSVKVKGSSHIYDLIRGDNTIVEYGVHNGDRF